MVSYITQLNTIRADNRVLLGQLVVLFSIDKCVKKVEYYIRDTKIDGIAKHEAFIYFTTPQPPLVELLITQVWLEVILTINISSSIVINLYEVGVVYSTSTEPTIADTKILFPTVYGTNSISIPLTVLDGDTFYFKAYTISCIGTHLGETMELSVYRGIGYDIIEFTLMVY